MHVVIVKRNVVYLCKTQRFLPRVHFFSEQLKVAYIAFVPQSGVPQFVEQALNVMLFVCIFVQDLPMLWRPAVRKAGPEDKPGVIGSKFSNELFHRHFLPGRSIRRAQRRLAFGLV